MLGGYTIKYGWKEVRGLKTLPTNNNLYGSDCNHVQV